MLVIGEGARSDKEAGSLEQVSANWVHLGKLISADRVSKKPPARANRGLYSLPMREGISPLSS